MTFDPSKHLVKLKGKDYLEVKYRIAWFRDEFPAGSIESEHVSITDNHAVFKAKVTKVFTNGVERSELGTATGYGSESSKDFGDFIEKAETKAIGRALAALGYGTQFAPELDEGTRIVDSPVPRQQPAQRPQDPPVRYDAGPDNAGVAAARERANKRVHALLDHDTVKAAVRVKYGLESTAEATAAQLNAIADLEEGKADRDTVQRWHAWKDKRKEQQVELLPDLQAVPNPDRFTN